jgi:hypothetical protein
MIRLNGTITGVGAVVANLRAGEDRVLTALELGVRRGVLGGQSIVRGNASGRPGPRVRTGDFRRSIIGDAERAGPVILGQIGTNAAQGPRLEFGFFGPDALGRVYNQPPYPYLQPSVPEVTALLVTEVTSALGNIL